jgi:multiple sugar transport system ATP-binding protein
VATISFEALGKSFGAVEAVRSVSLTTGPEEFLVLLGPSGCGKTTVLRMLAGLLAPTTGRILLDGRDITVLPPKSRDLAMVFQNYALYPHMTVAKNIGFALKLQKVPKREIEARVRDAAEMLELTDLLGRRPRELSGGQRQRVALGRALVRRPAAFLMDEPLSNLDAKLRTATRTEISDLHRRLGTTFVYVTHDQVEAMTMATRIAVMNGGRLEQVGTPVEVFDRPASTFVAGFIGAPPMNLVPAEIDGLDGQVWLRGAGVAGALFDGSCPARRVTVGVRPEQVSVLDEAGNGVGREHLVQFEAAVEAVENLGSEEVAHCRVGGRPFAVRRERPIGLRAGDRIGLGCPPDAVSLFDADTGTRIEWRPDPADASRPHALGAQRR